MGYWIAYKRKNGIRVYVYGIDECGKVIHTQERLDACRFHDLSCVVFLLQMGYAAIHEY